MLAQDEPVEHSAQRTELAWMVDALLSEIPEQHQKVFRLCYGLDGGRPLKQPEVRCCFHSCHPCNPPPLMACVQGDLA